MPGAAAIKARPAAGLSLGQLKLVSIAAMVVDHVAWAFVPYEAPLAVAMHFIGRLTGPIMFFAAVEGYHHTRSVNRYLLRLLSFALVSYFPFLLFNAHGDWTALNPLNLNVIYTILLGVLAIRVRREVRQPVLKILLLLLLACLSIPGDWGICGIAIILVFDFYRGSFRNQAFGYSLIVLFAVNVLSLVTSPVFDLVYAGGLRGDLSYYLFGLSDLGMFLPLLLLRRYNGGRGNAPGGKWLFYVFYPAHLLAIGLVARFVPSL